MTEMTNMVPVDEVPDDEDGLLHYLEKLIQQAHRAAATQVNATLTMRNWLIGRAINTNILRNSRADYGKEILASLTQELTRRFGPGFTVPALSRMMAFAKLYPGVTGGRYVCHPVS